jgi:hypothetical protein
MIDLAGEFGVQVQGFRVQEFRVQEFRSSGVQEFRVQVQGSGFRVQSSGFRGFSICIGLSFGICKEQMLL